MAEHGHGPGRDDGERSLERERELLRSTRRQLRGVTRVLRFADLMALLMVAATAFSGWAAWRTARVTALIYSTSERPFLGVERVSLESSDSDHPAIVVEFRNFGRVPAADAIVGVHALVNGKLVQPPDGEMGEIEAGIVSPTVPHFFYAVIPTDAYRKVVDGTANLMVRVRMEYKGPELGDRYCYFEKIVYDRYRKSFHLAGGSDKCGSDVF
jgi:hypothetical protein